MGEELPGVASCSVSVDSGWSAAGSAWVPERNSWEEEEEDEDVVSKWDLGGGMRPLVCEGWDGCSEPATGLRLRGPDDCVAWEGLVASGLVLWSARPGTGTSILGTSSGADSGLWSNCCRCCCCCCCQLSHFPLKGPKKREHF